MSKYCLKIANGHKITTGTVKKLVPNLTNKNNYVIHYRNLQQCLELGFDFNTHKRMISNNEADKDFLKWMNSVYGKTMENLRKWIKIRVVKNSQDFIRYTSRPTCVDWKVFENNLAAIHEKKICLTLNKPIYVGFTVLETSKWEMYNFHYNFMIRKFNTRLLFTDTDSLCYELHEKNPYKKMYKYKELFDLSNFPKSSKYYCDENKKIVGKMKDEYGGKSILKFVGLKSKTFNTRWK